TSSRQAQYGREAADSGGLSPLADSPRAGDVRIGSPQSTGRDPPVALSDQAKAWPGPPRQTQGGHMATKPRFRIRSSLLAGIAAAIGSLVFASVGVAATGTIFVSNTGGNVAAGAGPLFNGTFTSSDNVGLGFSVMPDLTSGTSNTATGNLA